MACNAQIRDHPIFVFDIDGTLTPSSDKMDEDFKKLFMDFCKDREVYLISGSNYEKTLFQVGEDMCMAVSGVFNCCGNQLRVKGELIYENDFDLTKEEEQTLNKELINSKWKLWTGRHIDKRVGLVNFSTIGRNTTKEERAKYVRWDRETKERQGIRDRLSKAFDRFDVAIAGETGVDIYLKGKDKGQVVDYLGKDIIFFGDNCGEKGNDYPIARRAKECHQVADWEATEFLLESLYIQPDLYKYIA